MRSASRRGSMLLDIESRVRLCCEITGLIYAWLPVLPPPRSCPRLTFQGLVSVSLSTSGPRVPLLKKVEYAALMCTNVRLPRSVEIDAVDCGKSVKSSITKRIALLRVANCRL